VFRGLEKNGIGSVPLRWQERGSCTTDETRKSSESVTAGDGEGTDLVKCKVEICRTGARADSDALGSSLKEAR